MGSARVITDSPAGALAEVRAHRAAADAHEAAILQAAAEWADRHPPDSVDDAAYVDGTEGEMAIAGDGAPLVAEFACAEFAAALGIPSAWGSSLVGDALELRHRLPRLWARVMKGDLQVWRAGPGGSPNTPGCCPSRGPPGSTVRWRRSHKRSDPPQTDRLVASALARFDPDQAEQERRAAADRRCFDVDHQQVSFSGTARVYGELDLADALALDAAVAAGADALARLGSTESLDVRRAQSVGELARCQPALELPAEAPEHDSVTEPRPRGGKRRQVLLYVHLSDAAVTGQDPVARVENGGGVRLVTSDQVREWCGHPDAEIVVKPVIDLTDHVSVDAYEVPDRLAERARLTHPSCVFPWCTRPARRCDQDHGLPYDGGGSTCDCNLAPPCRFHHRLKTHGRWVFTRVDETSMLWRSPHGLRFLRDTPAPAMSQETSPSNRCATRRTSSDLAPHPPPQPRRGIRRDRMLRAPRGRRGHSCRTVPLPGDCLVCDKHTEQPTVRSRCIATTSCTSGISRPRRRPTSVPSSSNRWLTRPDLPS